MHREKLSADRVVRQPDEILTKFKFANGEEFAGSFGAYLCWLIFLEKGLIEIADSD